MNDIFSVVIFVGMGLLTATIFMAFVRLFKGPSLPDRVVALDIMSVTALGVIALYAIDSGEAIFLDVALIVALVSFLGTVAFAYYVERGVTTTGGSR
ncbi:MAG: cation:proton antiporter [Syntrophobacteraceae bacterium]|jgi:multicomponent Na+:H+ antiporter subunit F|nr:cation:proton antiporter [Syntrophobacteraceae bacterium]